MTQLATQDPAALGRQWLAELENERKQREVATLTETENLAQTGRQFLQSITPEPAPEPEPQAAPVVGAVSQPGPQIGRFQTALTRAPFEFQKPEISKQERKRIEKSFGRKLGQAISTGFDRTTLMLIDKIVRGEPLEEPDLELWQQVVSEVSSFVLDPTTYLTFGLAGAVGRKAATKIAQKTLAKVTARAVTGSTGLAAFTGIKHPLETKAATGEFPSVGETALEAAKSGLLGGTAAVAGAVPVAGLPLEIGTFAAGGAALEGRLPKLEDFVKATGVILGIKLSNVVGKGLFKLARGTDLASAERKAIADVTPEQRKQIAQAAAEQGTAQARVQPTEQRPPSSEVAAQAEQMVREQPDAAQRLIGAADRAVQAKGPRGIPSKTDFIAEGLTTLKNRAERREFVEALREVGEPAPVAEVPRKTPKPTLPQEPTEVFAKKRFQAAKKPLRSLYRSPASKQSIELRAPKELLDRRIADMSDAELKILVEYLTADAGSGSPGIQRDVEFVDAVLVDEMNRREVTPAPPKPAVKPKAAPKAPAAAARPAVEAETITVTKSSVPAETFKQLDKERLGGSVGPQSFIKKFIQTIPEFKENPVFTFRDGMLVHKDGGTFRLKPDILGLDASTLKEGQQVRLDLKSFGVSAPTAKRKPAPKAKEAAKPVTITPQTEAPTKLSNKAKKARVEAGEALDELGEHLASTTFANPLADPKTIALVAKAAIKSVKAGVYTFADFIRSLARKLGDERVGRLGPLLVKEWNALRAKNPRMDTAGDVKAILKLGDRVEPRGRAPGLTELPKVNEANKSTPLDLLDQWFADRDEAITEAEIHAGQLQEQVKKLVRTGTYGKTAQELDQAIALYIDLKGKPEQFEKWGDKLSDEQARIYERSQNLSAAELRLADRIRLENRVHGRRAKEAGVIGSYLENYTARLWESPKELRKTLLRRFQLTTGRAKQRTLESILHGWAIGKTLRVTGATNAQLLARTEIASVIHDRNLIQLGARAGLLDDTQHTGWKRIEHPNFRKWVWAGKVEEGKIYGQDVYLTPEGDVFRRAELYAEPQLATKLNNALGRSALADIRPIEWVTKWNAITKHMILTVSLFHHQAFVRSSVLGSRSVRVVKSYEMGKQAIANYTQELRDLVRAGLTIGRVQDWEEDYLHQRTAIGRVLDKVPMARDIRDKLVEQRDRQTNFLFRKMGAYLKVQNGILEYRHLLKKHAKDIESGKRTRHFYARMAADVSNDDFGGLHLARMGRNPTVQHVFRLLTLAPDWTESNVRSMVKAFRRGDEASVYRALWGRVLIRGLGATALLNLALAGFDDDEFLKRYKRAWEQGNLRWLDVDVTPLYRRLGGTDEKRKWFSLIGHFRDPLKFIVHPIRSAKHKSSVLGAFVSDAATGTDWAGRPFTTFAELVGLDDKGQYKTTVKGRHVKGDPKGGKLKGSLVRPTRGGGGPLEYGQVPSYLLARARSTTPIPIQNGIAYFAGEIDGFDAITKSMGLMTSTTYPPSSPETSIKKAFELNDQEMAIAALDRLVSEAKAEATGTAIVKPRFRYIGRLVYGATNEKEPNELSRDLLPFLEISHSEARMAFKFYWRSRGYSTGSPTYRSRKRRLARFYLRGRFPRP